MSKRKRPSQSWKSFDFGPFCNSTPTRSKKKNVVKDNDVDLAEQNFLKENCTGKPSFDFFSQLSPSTIADLAVHTKKVEEVKFWLDNVIKFKNCKNVPILLLSGPTGAGKTTTLNVLCKSMNISMLEWTNPVDQDYEFVKGPNQINKFLEFLTTESNYNSLFESCNDRIVLVEDFPNIFIRNSEGFHKFLSECHYKCRHPIVFICTDSSNSKLNMVYNLFPQEIINKYQITHISFNACAPTLMKRCLKRAQELVIKNKEIFQVPSSNTVNAIVSSAMGDIRCAINQFYFASLLGTQEMPTEEQNTSSKSNKKSEKISSIKVMAKNETLGLFHALGKILNPKRKAHGSSWRLDCDLENLLMELESQPEKVVRFLYSNYLKYFGDLKDAQRAADLLCTCEQFLQKYYEKPEIAQYSLYISIVGLMISNEHKVSRWNQIVKPVKIEKMDQKYFNVDSFYINIINAKTKTNSDARQNYNIQDSD